MESVQDGQALDLLKKYVHASGSLRELSEAYGVSASDLRLDRLIKRLRVAKDPMRESPFEKTIRVSYLHGRIARPILRELMTAYREYIRGTV